MFLSVRPLQIVSLDVVCNVLSAGSAGRNEPNTTDAAADDTDNGDPGGMIWQLVPGTSRDHGSRVTNDVAR